MLSTIADDALLGIAAKQTDGRGSAQEVTCEACYDGSAECNGPD